LHHNKIQVHLHTLSCRDKLHNTLLQSCSSRKLNIQLLRLYSKFLVIIFQLKSGLIRLKSVKNILQPSNASNYWSSPISSILRSWGLFSPCIRQLLGLKYILKLHLLRLERKQF
jgi:hypothetical protein